MPLQVLSGFFAGNFHQDWDLDFNSVDELISDYATKAEQETLTTVLGELTILLKSETDCAVIRALLQRWGSYYIPADRPVYEWLEELADVIGRHAASRFYERPDYDGPSVHGGCC